RLAMVTSLRDERHRGACRQTRTRPEAVDPGRESRARHHRGDATAEGQAPLEHSLNEPSHRHFGEFGAAYLVKERPETASAEDLQAVECPGFRGEVLGCDRALPQPAGESAGVVL